VEVCRVITVPVVVGLLCACGHKTEAPLASSGPPYEAHCKEPLPVFTLGVNSHPTKEQESLLCSCVWENLHGWERDTSEKISQGKESEVPEMYLRGFPSRMGSAIKKCGGMNL
jgi:hypothetical protein